MGTAVTTRVSPEDIADAGLGETKANQEIITIRIKGHSRFFLFLFMCFSPKLFSDFTPKKPNKLVCKIGNVHQRPLTASNSFCRLVIRLFPLETLTLSF